MRQNAGILDEISDFILMARVGTRDALISSSVAMTQFHRHKEHRHANVPQLLQERRLSVARESDRHK
jgi:hypothetical protein